MATRPTPKSPAPRRAKAAVAPRADARTERLDARLSREQKLLFQRAANLEGLSLTEFVIASLQESARRTIREHETIALNAAESRRFVEALLHPPKPNAALRQAARTYREMIEDSALEQPR
jgi:uncharacterized protein (DUF1778 family)